MKNKIFENFTNDKFNKDENFKAILAKSKEAIDMKTKNKKILNIAAIILITVAVTVISPKIYAEFQWNVKFNEYKKRSVTTKQGELKSDYDEIVNMDYAIKDEIGVKVDSIALTDESFTAQINFKFPNNAKLNSETFSFGYAVYDENNRIYNITPRMHLGNIEKYDTYTKCLYKELGIKYDKKNIYDVQIADYSNSNNNSAQNFNIISEINLNTTSSFPKSKRIYIRIFDLGYNMIDKTNNYAENFQISDSEWIFEINIPDKFYNRKTTELKLSNEITAIEIKKFQITEKGITLNFKEKGITQQLLDAKELSQDDWKEYINSIVYITDENKQIYNAEMLNTGEENDLLQCIFTNISKNNLKNHRYYLNLKDKGQINTSEILIK